MTCAYIITTLPPYTEFWYTNTLKDINVKNPDCIIIISTSELGILPHLKLFFQKIDNWLTEKNKILYVLWPGADSKLTSHIHMVHSAGNVVGNVACVRNAVLFPLNIDCASKLFTCYNNNPKYHRKVLVDQLVKNDLITSGVVTYHDPSKPTEMHYQWKYHDGSRLYDEEDYVINSKYEYGPGLLPQSYLSGFIDIVSETNYDNEYFFLTEKTAKPLGTQKPFMVLSSKYFHKKLADEYGIEQYDELFDYTFDNYNSVEDRIDGIIKNIISLKENFSSNKNQLYELVKPKLERNRNAALNMIQSLVRRNKLVPAALKFIFKESTKLVGEIKNDIPEIVDKNWYSELPKVSRT